MTSCQTPTNPRSDKPLVHLHAQLEALEMTLTHMMNQAKEDRLVGEQLQKLFERLLDQCKAACPQDPLISGMNDRGGYGFRGGRQHLISDMLGKVRSLKAALPVLSAVPTSWMADIRATGRTLLRLLRLPFWPLIMLNQRIRIDERQPVSRLFIVIVEALAGALILYLLARFRLQP